MNELETFFTDNDQPTFGKVGIYGTAGTGKTRVATEIALGLIKDKKITKPVVFFDTEKGSDWVLPIFEKNGIKCYVKKSRTFADLLKAVEVAEKQASLMIVDSISHVWRELTESYLTQHNLDRKAALTKKYSSDWAEKNFKPVLQLEFQHWGAIKPMWAKFTERFLNSSLHMIVCGRAGDIYEYQENENGKKELIKSGSRMATEKELSYEPSLLIELQRRSINGEDKLFAMIEKDRSDTINGKEFELVKYADLKPHFDFINIGGIGKETNFNKNNSGEMFAGKTMNPEDEFAGEKRKREELSEEIWALFELKMPGRTDEAKKKKLELMEEVFGTMSKSKVESMNSTHLKEKLDQLRTRLQSE
jgi:hypothetical protein